MEAAAGGLHWQAEGSGGANVVLVPGIGSGSRLFGTLPRRFARAGHRCITFEPRGVPPSPPLGAAGFAFAAAADDLLGVLDASGASPAHLVGTSLGGKVALVAAARRPGHIASLTMLASSAVASSRSRHVYRYFETVARDLDAEAVGAAIAPFLVGRTFHESRPQLVDDIVRAVRPSPERRALMLAQARALRDFDGAPFARAWPGPTLLMAGAEDTLTSAAEVRATAELFADAHFVEIDDAGHSLLLESPRVFELVCAFLAGRLSR